MTHLQVLITGGSTGIGKEMVEILAKKTVNIAVLDMAEPTYSSSASLHFVLYALLLTDSCDVRRKCQVLHVRRDGSQGNR